MGYSGSMGALRAMQALGGAIAGLALCGMAACEAVADDTATPSMDDPPRVEAWSGVEAFHHFRSVYAGASWSPFGGIRDDGFRLRGVAGYGLYGLDRSETGNGTWASGDILIGYHKQLGTITIKVFGGLTILEYSPYPDEPCPVPSCSEHGAKGVLEGWWNISDQAWTSIDLSASSTHLDYSGRVRLGWRLQPELSTGLEAGSVGIPRNLEPELERDTSRVGAFLRYEWAAGEVSVSAGWAVGGTWRDREGAPEPFGTVSVLTRF